MQRRNNQIYILDGQHLAARQSAYAVDIKDALSLSLSLYYLNYNYLYIKSRTLARIYTFFCNYARKVCFFVSISQPVKFSLTDGHN